MGTTLFSYTNSFNSNLIDKQEITENRRQLAAREGPFSPESLKIGRLGVLITIKSGAEFKSIS